MEKGKVCCCVSGKKTAAKLQKLLQELGCEITHNKEKRECPAPSEQSHGNGTKPFRNPYELNFSGKVNPCSGVLCSPKPYVNPPNQMRKKTELLVTLDGRAVCGDDEPEPDIVWRDYGPRNPPWVRPRYASVELRGGVHHLKCSCGKRDGLRDDCPRWDCSGRPECLLNPWPDCCPHTTAHDYGVRPPNRIPAPIGYKYTADDC